MAPTRPFIPSYPSGLSLSRLLASLMLFCRLLSRIFWSSFFSLQQGKKTQESQTAKKKKYTSSLSKVLAACVQIKPRALKTWPDNCHTTTFVVACQRTRDGRPWKQTHRPNVLLTRLPELLQLSCMAVVGRLLQLLERLGTKFMKESANDLTEQ